MENLSKYNKFWASCGQTIGALILVFGARFGFSEAEANQIGMALVFICNGAVYAVRNRKTGTDLEPDPSIGQGPSK